MITFSFSIDFNSISDTLTANSLSPFKS